MFAALVCEHTGISECWIFALAPVLGAFGSAISRVVHVYDRGIVDSRVGQSYANAASIAVVAMREHAAVELRAEGLEPSKAVFEVECRIAESGGAELSISVGKIGPAEGAEEVERKIDTAVRLRVPDTAAGTRIVTAIVTASYAVPAHQPETHAKLRKAKKMARPRGTRDLYFNGSWHKASVFDWNRLVAGQIVQGPSIASSDILTCLVPPGWRLEVDEHRNGRLARNS
jgi:N-methylhydantoinase A/oxoprolinase/acetone carboxylase beta subunit